MKTQIQQYTHISQHQLQTDPSKIDQNKSKKCQSHQLNFLIVFSLTSVIGLIFIICRLTHQIDILSIQLSNISSQQLSLEESSNKYSSFVNLTLESFALNFQTIQNQIKSVNSSLRLELYTQKQADNVISNHLQETQSFLLDIETERLQNQFISRTQAMKDVIDNMNATVFNTDFEQHKDKFWLTLNNVQNPLSNPQDRVNQTNLMNELLEKEYKRYNSKYKIDSYQHQLSMCAVVSVWNNRQNYRYLYNIGSILNQKYQNYRVVLVDDASPDQTGLLLKRYLRKNNIPEYKAIVYIRQHRHGSLANIDFAIKHYCTNYSIILTIDGDDQLIGQNVFKLYNAIYQSKNPGIAYSNHIYYVHSDRNIYRSYSAPYSELSIQKQNYRKVPQKFGHLRSFRTQIYLSINQQDLRDYNGQFYMATGDEAFIFPILEMSCRNIQYIDEITYLYNAGTGKNVKTLFHDLQEKNAIYIRLLKKYPCLPMYDWKTAQKKEEDEIQ